MTEFIIALCVLVGGYFVYGLLAERVFGIDPARKTPADTMRDGVDYVPLPTWRVFLIQFLNIAGLGPIFGAIMGVCSVRPHFCGLCSAPYSQEPCTTSYRP